MTEEQEIYPAVLEKISRDFSTSKIEIEYEDEFCVSDISLKNYLSEKILELMENDFERLLNNLYRIDVREDKVNKVLKESPFDEVPNQLADLIIERQIQRLETQRLYKEGKL